MAMSEKNIYQRIAAVMAEVDYIQKEKKQGMRYSIVSHDAVTAKVRPILLKHGVVYWPESLLREQVGNTTMVNLSVRFQNIDNPDDFLAVETCGYGVDDQDKGPGKAMSYAVKYALLKCLGLETGDDPDIEQDRPSDIGEVEKVRAQIASARTNQDLLAIQSSISSKPETFKAALRKDYMAAMERVGGR
jgi:hypothetical protein